MTAPLDPVIAQIIPLLPLRDPGTMTPQSARDSLRALAAARAAVPPPPVASVRGYRGGGRGGATGRAGLSVSQEKSPTVVFFHGGGWVAGDLETHDRQARLLAIETGAVVVSVDYRRPPETRFPGAFEDSFAATRDVFGRLAEFGGTAGGSASPGIVRAAIWRRGRDRLSRRRDRARRAIAGLSRHRCRRELRRRDENARFPSRAENAEGYFLSRDVMQWFAGHYLEDKTWRGLACFALAREEPCRARAGDGVHGVVRSVAR